MDSMSNTESHNLQLFMMVTHSPCGALPLAVFLTNNEQKDTLILGLNLVKECLPEFAFFNRGKDMEPKVFITNNSSEERESHQYVWPQANLVLCLFHAIEQIWHWLFDKNHHIPEAERPVLMNLVKSIAYADSIDDMEDAYCEMNNQLEERYNNFLEYFETSLYSIKEQWCKAYRSRLPLRGNRTNNYVESQF